MCFSVGPKPEESREQVCPAAENCGSSHQTVQRRGSRQDGEEEAEKQLFGRHEDTGRYREGNQRLQDEEGKETHPEGLADHSRWRRCKLKGLAL